MLDLAYVRGNLPEVEAALKTAQHRHCEEVRKCGFDYASHIHWGNVETRPIPALRVHNLDWLAKGALDFLEESHAKKDKPFFLCVAPTTFHGPHHVASLDADPRLTNEVKREQTFYSDQSKALSTFITILGMTLTVIFSIGAMIGAMITMYASVSSRVAEIGTLRALGFRRASVLYAFVAESLLLGLAGGVAGLACAAFMQFASFSTTNFQTFADLSFRFTLTPGIAVSTLAFSLGMGLVGGFLPALHAARMGIVDALRAN